MEQEKKKFEGKVTQLIALDKELWKEFKQYREPYGTINELFEDCIRILLGHRPKHIELLKRFKQIVPTISEE